MPKFCRLSSSLLIFSFLTGCGSLPEEIVHSSHKAVNQSETQLSELSENYWLDHAGSDSSAIAIQKSGWEALAQRLALVESAQNSIDIQYYIWNSDQSGTYLASRLLAAADRGVHVRVMLDDINLNQRETLLIALNSHPNVEIRVFNPIPTRRGVTKWLEFVGDFSRLNRRMHNKSFTVDGSFSVVGGRNIGDEYFDLSEELNFRDRDVLVMGSVVNEVQEGFEQYWNSRWSYPVDLLGNSEEVNLTELEQAPVPNYLAYPPLPSEKAHAQLLLADTIKQMDRVEANYVYDQPVPVDEKDTNKPKTTAKYLSQLARQSSQQVLLESAYLVFDDRQLDNWYALSENGVTVKALTNSMASNDLVTNHSAYAGRRQDMLEHNIQLFELMPEAQVCYTSTRDTSKCAPEAGYGLHSKLAVFDQQVAVVGSFNFNLRSTYLNSESLLVIENPAVAQKLADDITDAMSVENSWHLELKDGDVIWNGEDQSFDHEPNTGKWRRFQSSFLQLLPIEKYL